MGKILDLSKPTQKKRLIKSILKTEKPKCSDRSHKKVHFDKDTTSGNANPLTVFDRQQGIKLISSFIYILF